MNHAAKFLAVIGTGAALLGGVQRTMAEDLAIKDPRAAVDEIDRKIESLQQQREQLERLAEKQEKLIDLQDQASERVQGLTDELSELASAEPTDSPAEKSQRENRKKMLEGQAKLFDEIAAVKDASGLDKARELFARAEDLQNEWEIVIGPRDEAAITLERLESDAESDETTPAQRELLKLVRALFKEDATAREALLQAKKTTVAHEREVQKLVERFHSGQ